MTVPKRDWNKEKKDRELAQLKAFTESLPELIDATITNCPVDPPDGILRVHDKTIGVELTEILWDPDHKGLNKKAQLSIGEDIVLLAQQKYEAKGLRPVLVWVSFVDDFGLKRPSKYVYLQKTDKHDLSDYLVNLVVAKLPLVSAQLLEVPDYDERGKRILHGKIQSVYIQSLDSFPENCWTITGGGVIPSLTYEKVASLILQKNVAANRFSMPVDEKWLVIVEYWNDIASNFSFRNSEDVLASEFNSSYDKIFILRSRTREAIPLVIRRI